jgi:hypothetical protein
VALSHHRLIANQVRPWRPTRAAEPLEKLEKFFLTPISVPEVALSRRLAGSREFFELAGSWDAVFLGPGLRRAMEK